MKVAPFLTRDGLDQRWMLRRDWPAVLAIDAASFPGRGWDEDKLYKFLHDRNSIGMVAEDRAGRIVGFMVYVLGKHEIRLVRLAVYPDARRMGVGMAMMANVVRKLGPRRRRLTLCVRESNIEACKFYRSAGLHAEAVLRDHYGDEDAYLFSYEAREDG